MKKTVRLSVILGVLILVSILLALTGGKDNRRSFDSNLFTVADTASVVGISIKTLDKSMKIERGASGWRVNEQYKADPSLVKVMQSILSRVRIKRPVSKLNMEDVVVDLQNNGRAVSIDFDDNSTLTFFAGGSSSKKLSTYSDGDKAYVVEIPGYDNYISGIFELSENQWRDRLLFSSTWRSLQSLDIDYASGQEDVSIYFDKKFLAVSGVEKLDTAALMSYVEQYQYFQINDFLDKGTYPRYDSLLLTQPLAKIDIKDIDLSKNGVIEVYPKIPGEQFYLTSNEAREMMVIDAQRMNKLLSKKDQFISE
ncbi:MAG: hypothetical protein JXQ96_01195 [Cyclobacteriaceae bacterium]